MKKTKRISALLLCLLMLCSTVLLCACQNEPEQPESTDAAYKVTVVDGLGNPYTEKIIVKFIQNGKQVAMGAVNAQGIVEKVLPCGEYNVELASTNNKLECHFLETKLTKDVTEAQVIMAYAPTETGEIGVPTGEVDEDGNELYYQAGKVSVGSSYIKMDAEGRTYVTFSPIQAGTYEFSVTNDDAAVGYYGMPQFVQENNVAEKVNGNKFTVSVSASMINTGDTGTSVFVIGLDANEGKDGCILNVARIGDPAWNIADEPWIEYQPKVEIKDFTLPEGTVLTDFDVTASTDSYKLVFNDQDRCYHLGTADGPAVYVNLEKNVYGISMLAMVGENIFDSYGNPIESGTASFRYTKDNGPDDFYKEEYTVVTRKMITARDKTTGVYPLTEDLYYILTMGVDSMGWARKGTMNYLFNGEPGVNEEIAWMFLMCHAQADTSNDNTGDNTGNKPNDKPTKPDPIVDNKDNPFEIGGTLEFEAEVKANHLVYFDLMRVNDTTLTIKSKDAYVIYNNKTYEPVNGVVSVPNLYSKDINQPVQIAIGNSGTKDANLEVKLVYPSGHSENPKKIEFKTLTVENKKGNSSGTYYTWTATKAGTLTITLDSITTGVDPRIVVDRIRGEIPVQFAMDEEGGTTLTIDVEAGDTFKINIGVMPDKNWKYPAATIKVTPSFK